MPSFTDFVYLFRVLPPTRTPQKPPKADVVFVLSTPILRLEAAQTMAWGQFCRILRRVETPRLLCGPLPPRELGLAPGGGPTEGHLHREPLGTLDYFSRCHPPGVLWAILGPAKGRPKRALLVHWFIGSLACSGIRCGVQRLLPEAE